MKNFYKRISKTVLSEELQKMLYHFEIYNFLNIKKKAVTLKYNGESLKQNIQNEWIISNSICCDEPSFQYTSLNTNMDLLNAYNGVKSFIKQLPCSIISIGKSERAQLKTVCNDYSDAIDVINNYFNNKTGIILKRHLICSPETSNEYFHKLQRERKIWWKKFSASPGRYYLSQIYHDNENADFVVIEAEFPWGTATVEKITLLPEIIALDSLKEKKNEEKPVAHVIISETVLEKVAFTLLLDSFETINGKTEKNILRFHRRLAPYKVSFSCVASNSHAERDLRDLSLLLTKQIRKNSISVLLLPDACSDLVENQIIRNDALGIPYTIIMNDKTLKDGLLKIRSRDTTLEEESHVSLLVPYIEKLMKTY